MSDDMQMPQGKTPELQLLAWLRLKEAAEGGLGHRHKLSLFKYLDVPRAARPYIYPEELN